MTRSFIIAGLAAVCAVVVGGYFAIAGASGDHDAPIAAPDGAHLQQYPWSLLDVGSAGRSLVVQYRPPSCGGPGHPVVEETSTTVTIRISGQVVVPSRERHIICGNTLMTPQLVVPLAAPIAGRRILGEDRSIRRLSFGYRHTSSGTQRPLVPNVVGLSQADASSLLRSQGFRPAIKGHGGVVIGQRPARGHVAVGAKPHSDDGGKVELILGA